jgi:ABC-type branched-subunit amino acid transport system substrate-binding protein
MRSPHRRRLAAAVLVGMAFLSACSGAKVPGALEQNDEQPDDSQSEAPDGSASPGSSASAKPGVSAKPGSPGATAGPSARGTTGGTPGGSTTAPGGGTTATAGPVPGGGTVSGGNGITLYSGADNTTGITADSITLCAHAALTYGAAFDTSAADFNVYWDALNDKGGIYGRKVNLTWEDDKYTAQDAITAATTCKSRNPFLLIGGIGFDQIPAVRNWAEQNKMLYLHHSATVKGSEGKRFSYTALPTVEKLGETFAELAAKRYRGKKIAIMHRDSVNWDPGYEAFLRLARTLGLTILEDGDVKTQNDHNHLQRVLKAKDSGAEVVWLWENALVSTEIITTADQQDFHPTWLAFPFNLTTQGLQTAKIEAEMVGVAAWPAYSKGDTSGLFANYADDIREFEAQYREYRPSAKLDSLGGDLLFLNWVGQKTLHQMFLACGQNCTRNAFASLFHNGFKLTVQGCSIDFTRSPYRGSYQVNVFEPYDGSPTGKRNWRPVALCREHI